MNFRTLMQHKERPPSVTDDERLTQLREKGLRKVDMVHKLPQANSLISALVLAM